MRPGDTLVLRVARPMTPKELDEVKAEMARRLLGVQVVVLSGVDDMRVYRPDSDEIVR